MVAPQPKGPLISLFSEVFVQPKEGKPFQHEGIVHAPDLSWHMYLPKRISPAVFTCTSPHVVDTRNVFVCYHQRAIKNAYGTVATRPFPK